MKCYNFDSCNAEEYKAQIVERDAVIERQRENMTRLTRGVETLKRIISKELTENDELGSEYVYVNALKGQLQSQAVRLTVMRKALNSSDCGCSGETPDGESPICFRCLTLSVPPSKWEQRLQGLVDALKRISSEKDIVESQSTGMKQYFKTLGAKIAGEALADWEGKK